MNNIEKYHHNVKTYYNNTGVKRVCNICGYNLKKFLDFGTNPREAQCPICGSLERHRHLSLFLNALYPFLENKRILHFAPEKIIKNLLIESNALYYDCDINPTKASYKIDITNIDFKDNYFDYIICIHVLEHIIDDVVAMNELYRVLSPGGTSFICVPLKEKYKEDYTIVDPEERLKEYGLRDHVRQYNLELITKRLESVGFKLNISSYKQFEQVCARSLLSDTIILASK